MPEVGKKRGDRGWFSVTLLETRGPGLIYYCVTGTVSNAREICPHFRTLLRTDKCNRGCPQCI
ncbi:hypothetical protein SSCH_1760004 [Syntrophaceticus schinkii]|uniref:C3H1-type domain-containing protein n=1 Tax=Syntrophaceticus schinkii TaxID=499207 RepID=A0A0B7ME42_9FIRM|nr:hypothetical protein SSCH_1760004 [Syntrophaceticus schinkii]